MTVAITGGYVVPVTSEPIEGGTVLIEGGRIVAVGADADVDVPDDAEIVDASGTWVLPGFVEAHAHAGIGEDGIGWEGRDYNEMTDPNGARLRAIDGFNPDDQGLRDALAGGVTTLVAKPGSGNPIGGQTVALKAWGRTVEDMLMRDPASVKSALGENPKRVYGDQKKLPSTRMGVAAIIRDALTKAQDYVKKRDQAAADDKPFDRDNTMEILARVLSGEVPWCQHTHRADDIATAIRLADEFGYRLVVNHGTEGHLLADTLAERGIPVIVGPLMTSRGKIETGRRTLKGPGIMARAGVKIALTTDHPVVPIDFLVHQATLCVKEGLDTDTALRSITINPAEMMGLDDRVGALAAGLDADVVLWSGDPLDVMSRAVRVFIEGNEVYYYDDAKGEGITKNPFYSE
ncbi:amidohydrolase [Kibdelosporangium phytohabitans]|uniref:Amidohydrolase n=1 Tax=Kibdelosporangium phytohabitans TaxID=860235 RepID=A0A0N7F2K5_9PSEU|nr:amidohydrolase [Kibdelosporangium phytohabitans]ALG06087.1 amidohydrolase [Kibdelosporangium phytohabitans]MBE1465827.1 imidazolonepropionase-like amidohydrolase [Kibdelosporangium phytohabitans]